MRSPPRPYRHGRYGESYGRAGEARVGPSADSVSGSAPIPAVKGLNRRRSACTGCRSRRSSFGFYAAPIVIAGDGKVYNFTALFIRELG